MIKFIKGIILIVATFALFTIFYDYGKHWYNIYQEEYKGTTSTVGEDVVVEIPEGAAAKTIAKILKEKELIHFERAFVKRLQESSYRVQSGTYTLNTGMSTLDMIKTMSPVIEVDEKIDTLVIPEGFTIEQIAARCEKQGSRLRGGRGLNGGRRRGFSPKVRAHPAACSWVCRVSGATVMSFIDMERYWSST